MMSRGRRRRRRRLPTGGNEAQREAMRYSTTSGYEVQAFISIEVSYYTSSLLYSNERRATSNRPDTAPPATALWSGPSDEQKRKQIDISR